MIFIDNESSNYFFIFVIKKFRKKKQFPYQVKIAMIENNLYLLYKKDILKKFGGEDVSKVYMCIKNRYKLLF